MLNRDIAATNLHNEITDLEIWIDSNPNAQADDIIHVRLQIIRKRIQLGILRFKTIENATNNHTTKISRR